MMHLWQNKKKSRKQILHMKRKWYVIFGTVYSYSVLMHLFKIDLGFLFACLTGFIKICLGIKKYLSNLKQKISRRTLLGAFFPAF